MWINERVRRTLTLGVVVALPAVVAVGCGDDDDDVPTTGGIQVVTVTTGDNIDVDGYTISLDGNLAGAIDVNGQVVIPDLTAGDYQVGLTEVAANCTVAGDNPRAVNVTAGQTENTQFDVACTGAPAAVTLAAATDADEVTGSRTVSTTSRRSTRSTTRARARATPRTSPRTSSRGTRISRSACTRRARARRRTTTRFPTAASKSEPTSRTRTSPARAATARRRVWVRSSVARATGATTRSIRSWVPS